MKNIFTNSIDNNIVLQEMCREKLEMLLLNKSNNEQVRYQERLKYELNYIRDNDCAYIFLTFFEVITSILDLAFYIGGSMAGSLVSYLLCLTRSDPLDEYVPLYFDLFISEKNRLEPVTLYVDDRYKDTVSNLFLESKYSKCFGVCKYVQEENDFVIRNSVFALFENNLDPIRYTSYLIEIRGKIYLDINYFYKGERQECYVFEICESVDCSIVGRVISATIYDIGKLTPYIDIFSECNYEIMSIDEYEFNERLQIINQCNPISYEEYVKCICIAFSGGLKREYNNTVFLDKVVASQEDVYEMLIQNGMDKKHAAKFAQDIRKYRMDYNVVVSSINNKNCCKYMTVGRLSQRASVCEYVLFSLILNDYKHYRNEVFFRIYFEEFASDLVKHYMIRDDFEGYKRELDIRSSLFQKNKSRAYDKYWMDYFLWCELKNKIL